MAFAFGGVSTLSFDGTIQWTSRTSEDNPLEPESVVGRKLWNWSPSADSARRAIADALFDNEPQSFVAGWMPEGSGRLLHTKATVYPLPRGKAHDLVLSWAEPHAGHALTKAETRTLRCFADGMTASEAARHLGVTAATVKTTLSHARQKLNARNVTHAVSLAQRRGLI